MSRGIDIAYRAAQARELLANPVLSSAFEDVRETIIRTIENTPLDGTKLPARLVRDQHALLLALREVRAQLNHYANDRPQKDDEE